MITNNSRLAMLIGLLISPAHMSFAANLMGEWCENGGPYICYPPIDNKTSRYICTDSTHVANATKDAIEFVTKQTIHFYSDGFKNGQTKTRLIKDKFERANNTNNNTFTLVENTRDEETLRQLTVKNDTLELSFRNRRKSSEQPANIAKINYQRCSDDPKKKTFYTALVDCGGTGDYIAGVPAVVNNPLMWDLGEQSTIDKSKCRVAARCWGGGWVAYAKSTQPNDSETEYQGKAAFGAACGTKDRHEAKQQAINSCRESGGTNCLSLVVSGFDNGSNEENDTAHKGTKIERCSFGDCRN